jgi:adenosylcobyric acid synthase
MGSMAPCLMIQGTASGAGKSVLTAAFCRLFARRGYRVKPFKSQNMALNAFVTADGGEIGRAQAAQAEAACVAPSVDMNPILLKPESDHCAQVVVRGAAVGSVDFREYERMKPALRPIVAASLARLRRTADLVVIEGAGSPAEINLNAHEIVNMAVARMAGAPVLLVGDIDRGGVFAAFVGTLALLDPEDRARVAGFVINKFRGDAGLLGPGIEMLAARTGVPVFGTVPYLDRWLIPSEDSLDLDTLDSEPLIGDQRRSTGDSELTAGDSEPSAADAAQIDIAVVRLPRIANFDDFEPLAREPRVRVRFVRCPTDLGDVDLIILPGSKSTIADLRWLRERGWDDVITVAAARGRPILGICGGYQMLGLALLDPAHVESEVAHERGLGLLPVETTFAQTKTTVQIAAEAAAGTGLFGSAAGIRLAAYEIHAGRTVLRASPGLQCGGSPFVIAERQGRPLGEIEGATNATGNVQGTYLHGLFANGSIRRAALTHLARRRGIPADPRWGAPPPIDPYDRLADVIEVVLDIPAIARLVGLEPSP